MNEHATAPVPGIDFGWGSISAASAKALGAKFGCSYLSTDAAKNWSKALIDSYHAAGLATVCVWETAAGRALDGQAAGQADAKQALAQARALGFPSSRPIYFAVDFDETPAQATQVAEYFKGVNSVLGVDRTGAYGGYWTVSRLFNAKLIKYGWQTYAWSGGQWDKRAQIQQYQNGPSFDHDRAMAADYGQTPYSAPKPKPKPKPPAVKHATGVMNLAVVFNASPPHAGHNWQITKAAGGNFKAGSEDHWASAEVQVNMKTGAVRILGMPWNSPPLGG